MATKSTAREFEAKLLAFVRFNPEMTYTAIAAKLSCSVNSISRICLRNGIRRNKPALSLDDLKKLEG